MLTFKSLALGLYTITTAATFIPVLSQVIFWMKNSFLKKIIDTLSIILEQPSTHLTIDSLVFFKADGPSFQGHSDPSPEYSGKPSVKLQKIKRMQRY